MKKRRGMGTEVDPAVTGVINLSVVFREPSRRTLMTHGCS